MATPNSSKKEKTVTLKTFKTWEPNLRDNFDVTVRDGTIIKAVCKVCNENCNKIKATYKGKVVEDVVKYGQNGTTHILKR